MTCLPLLTRDMTYGMSHLWPWSPPHFWLFGANHQRHGVPTCPNEDGAIHRKKKQTDFHQFTIINQFSINQFTIIGLLQTIYHQKSACHLQSSITIIHHSRHPVACAPKMLPPAKGPRRISRVDAWFVQQSGRRPADAAATGATMDGYGYGYLVIPWRLPR